MLAVKVIPNRHDPGVDDVRAIEAVLAGDPEAFGILVRAYQGRIFGICLRLLRDRGEAECAAQDAFLKAYRALADFRGGSSFETWLTRIAVNGCRDRLKRKRHVLFFHQSAAPDGEDAVDPPASPEPSAERLVLSREIRDRLTAAIGELSPKQRVVFTLKHMEQRSIPEIARLMGLDSGTVKSHLFRAAKRVRARLNEFWRSR